MRVKIIIYGCFILGTLKPGQVVSAKDDYAATDSLAISEMTTEELQLYQADYFPFSMAEKGRQSAPSWRGMPPGYLNYHYDQIPLYNPLWGYWDNQHVPLELIRHRELDTSELKYRLVPVKVKPSDKPITRIVYAQDFQFGLSYLDASLTTFYRPKSYFKLSGNNLLHSGTAGNTLSAVQVNTYRIQFHHHISERWNLDLFYWQIRHKFILSSFPVVTDIFHVHRIGQLSWANINYQPDSTQKLILTPYAYKWGDRYRNENYTEQRKTEEYSIGFKGKYQRQFERMRLELWGDLIRHDITEAFVFIPKELWDISLGAKLRWGSGSSWIEAGGGYKYVSVAEGGAEISFSWGVKPLDFLYSQISVYQSPRKIPMAAINWTGYGIKALQDAQLPLSRGVSWKLGLELTNNSTFSVEPFYNSLKNAVAYHTTDSLFYQTDYDNSGVQVSLRTKLWLFELENDFTFNDNYQNSFIPQVNNVLKLNLPLNLLKGALGLENYLIYHYVGSWRRLDYVPLVNQYVRTNQESGEYHILDVKILGHIKTATIFLVWENLASQDYAFVDSYFELYRLFRFGVYWTLFD